MNQQGGLSCQHFPQLIGLLNKLSEQDQAISQQFASILWEYRMNTIWSKDACKAYFNEWAVISFEEAGNPSKQEAEVNRFFNTLKNQGLYKDMKVMQKFCKTMVELSVERALLLSDGMTKRPADRLVYRYIESLLNFLVVSLMNFTSQADGISKQEFLAQFLEAVFQVLDEDHHSRKGDFNQKPYYRIFINILRVLSTT